jgi:DNA-directed RNA polymerase II subunit RPB2
MNTIERPIVSNKFAKYVAYDDLPNGINCVIAIASYSGYNQEDSLIINQHALDRGLFRATIYHTYKDEEKKIQSSGKEEKFTLPDAKSKYIINKKPGDYSKLDERGFVKKDVFVDSQAIIIGKVLPLKQKSPTGHQLYKDCSTSLRINESGFVDKVYVNRNAEGVRFCNVRIRSERIPKNGDKFASRCGQKGTCGITYAQHNMPFNKNGMSPDAIMNPHALPSRMTIGQALESLLGKTAAIYGGIADCTPFSEVEPDIVGDILENNGFNRCGNEVLYNGMTGQQMHCDIFMGPTFYQRLKHMVDDKIHSRSSGPVVQITRQPAEGRSRDGGLRFGEMERDCIISHGAIGFLKEKMVDVSDLFEIYACRECGLFADVNPEKDIYKCPGCENSSDFAKLHIPYACKLLMQELQGMTLAPRIKFDTKINSN